ncbi:MAG: ABC transporter ATP-binding protein [Oscillospiraceae bacterium]|nr:ABC transporter ATP-binding protein [Oscillospiraceae bacterium]
MAEKLLEIKDLFVEYLTDDAVVYAVNGIDLDVAEGETLGLVGETGAGKTTTALSILRLLPDRVGKITKGTILFRGESVLDKDDREMRELRGESISMIFQDPMTSLNPTMTVGEQIAEVLTLHNAEGLDHNGIETKVDELLEMVGIPSDRKTEYPHQFSGGMKQRVVIAMALSCKPKLLLADEPTTALDVTIQAQVLKMMDDLKSQLKTSMILITHDLGVVAEMCDRVAIMYAGEIIEIGTIEDIFESKDHHPYTVGLFGSIPNMEKDERRLHPIDGLMPDPTDLPDGCVFCDRCPRAMEICRTSKPDTYSSNGHQIKCHLFDDRRGKD